MKMTGSSEEFFFCGEDQLYMCPNASLPDTYRDVYGLHYQLYARTEFSHKLNSARWKFILDNTTNIYSVLDFGCGARAFELAKPKLMMNVISYDPYFYNNMEGVLDTCNLGIDVLTFWDSFEHIRRLEMIPLLKARYIVLGIPIFTNGIDIIQWKHFRPDEHVWCFSEMALKRLMRKWKYEEVAHSLFEVELGRSDIHAFIFRISEV
jgi:hypothetical protein